MLRAARIGDVPRMVELGAAFFLESGYAELTGYDPESAAGTLAGLIESETGAVFVLDVDGEVAGAIGGMLAPHYFNLEKIVGMELFWFVAAEHRGRREALRLVQALETWAADQGASLLTMAALAASPPGVADLYQRRGYRRMETHYTRRL